MEYDLTRNKILFILKNANCLIFSSVFQVSVSNIGENSVQMQSSSSCVHTDFLFEEQGRCSKEIRSHGWRNGCK